jgi:D-alanyl-D-alanine carboxypeptidase
MRTTKAGGEVDFLGRHTGQPKSVLLARLVIFAMLLMPLAKAAPAAEVVAITSITYSARSLVSVGQFVSANSVVSLCTVLEAEYTQRVPWYLLRCTQSFASGVGNMLNLNFSAPTMIADISVATNFTLTANCPVHATGSTTGAFDAGFLPSQLIPSCTCNAAYRADTTATACVSEAVCPIPPLTPLTDQAAIDFEGGNRWRPDLLTPAYQTKLSCVQNGITNRGGSYANTSAYRPTQYQRHLSEIVSKERDLTVAGYMDAHPECQALLNSVTGQMAAHGLRHRQAVAAPNTSRHESGTAFDVTPIGLTDAQIAPIYSSCGVSNAVVAGERWHVQ